MLSHQEAKEAKHAVKSAGPPWGHGCEDGLGSLAVWQSLAVLQVCSLVAAVCSLASAVCWPTASRILGPRRNAYPSPGVVLSTRAALSGSLAPPSKYSQIQHMLPVQQKMVPVQQNMVPEQQNMVPVQQKIVPVQQVMVPV